MNLTPHEYLTLVDQISLLKIENERYQRDNVTLSHQIQDQRKVIHEFKENDRKALEAYSSGRLFYETAKSFGTKSTGFDAEQLHESLGHLQQNVCQFFSTSTTEQMKHLKEQINKIRLQLKSLKSKRLTGEESKTEKSSKREQASEKLSKENHRKELQDFLEKVKLVYHLWNPDQKDPSQEDLIKWMNRLHLKNTKAKPDQQFNPIRAIKQARSQKKQLERNEIALQIKREANSSKKSKTNRQEVEKRLVEEGLKLPTKNGESKRRVEREKSIPNDQESQISILKPKLKKQSKKDIERETSKIKKKSITLHKGPLRMIKQQKQSQHSRQNSNISDLKKSDKNLSVNGSKNYESAKSIKGGESWKKQGLQKRRKSNNKILAKSKSQTNLSKDIDILKQKIKKLEYLSDAPSKIAKTSKQMKVQPQGYKYRKY